MATPAKISIYSINDLKATLDDHLPIYLSTSTTPSKQPLPRELRFTPSYLLTYIRLGLGYSAVLLGVYAFYIDYIQKQTFEQQKPYLWIAVPIYFLLNGGLTVFIWFLEKGCVFQGSRKQDGANIRIDSLPAPKKYEPIYKLKATVSSKADSHAREIEVTAPFEKFFRTDKTFAPAEFEAWLRQTIPVIEPGSKVKAEELVEDDEDTIVVATGNDTSSPRKKGRKKA